MKRKQRSMKPYLPLTLLCILAISGTLHAQVETSQVRRYENSDVYRVKEGSDLMKVIPLQDRFLYNQFSDGVAYMRNGRVVKSKFNYSVVHGEVMFISPTRDTLLLSDPEFVSLVTIDKSIYYFQKGHGHVELVGDYGRVSLGRKPFFVRLGNEKYASYEQYSSASAISSYSTYTNGNGELKFLEGRDNAILKRRVNLFLIDKNHRMYPANRASLSRMYPRNKSRINAFLKDNSIDFEKEDDLRKTLEFCSAL